MPTPRERERARREREQRQARRQRQAAAGKEPKPTKREKARELAKAAKERLISQITAAYEEAHGKPPGRRFIQRLLDDKRSKLGKILETQEAGAAAEEGKRGIFAEILGAYEEIHGVPAPRDFIDRLLNKTGTQLAEILKGMEPAVAANVEHDEMVDNLIEAYEDLHGAPPSAELIGQYQGMSVQDLLTASKDIQKNLGIKERSEEAEQAVLAEMAAFYIDFWGKAPPTGWAEEQVKMGKNVYQVEWELWQDPAASNSKAYKQRQMDQVSGLLSGLGAV